MNILSENAKLENARLVGLDYLAFWAFGQECEEFRRHIEDVQRRAQAVGQPVLTVYNGLEIKVLPGGGGPPGVYRRSVQWFAAGIYFGMCKTTSDTARPQFKVEAKGEIFTRLGEAETLQVIKDVFVHVNFTYETSKVSRVDVRADFADSFRPEDVLQLIRDGKQVARANKFSAVWSSGMNTETVYIGQGKSDVSCRVYDKLVESSSESKIDFFEQVLLGGDKVKSLTRVEFQLRRSALVERVEIDSVEDLLGGMARLVEYVTWDWLRFYADPVDRGNTEKDVSNKRLHPIWNAVRTTLEDFADGWESRKYERRVTRSQPVDQQKNLALTYLTKVAAFTGQEFECVGDLFDFIKREFLDAGLGMQDLRKRVGVHVKKRNAADLARWTDALDDLRANLGTAVPFFA